MKWCSKFDEINFVLRLKRDQLRKKQLPWLQKMLGHLPFSIRLSTPLLAPFQCWYHSEVCAMRPKARQNTLFIENNIEIEGRAMKRAIMFCLPQSREGSAIFRGVPATFCKDCSTI